MSQTGRSVSRLHLLPLVGALTLAAAAPFFAPVAARASHGDLVLQSQPEVSGCMGVRTTPGSRNTVMTLLEADLRPRGWARFELSFPLGDASGREAFVMTDCVFIAGSPVQKYLIPIAPNEYHVTFVLQIPADAPYGASYCNYAATTAAPSNSPGSNRKAASNCWALAPDPMTGDPEIVDLPGSRETGSTDETATDGSAGGGTDLGGDPGSGDVDSGSGGDEDGDGRQDDGKTAPGAGDEGGSDAPGDGMAPGNGASDPTPDDGKKLSPAPGAGDGEAPADDGGKDLGATPRDAGTPRDAAPVDDSSETVTLPRRLPDTAVTGPVGAPLDLAGWPALAVAWMRLLAVFRGSAERRERD